MNTVGFPKSRFFEMSKKCKSPILELIILFVDWKWRHILVHSFFWENSGTCSGLFLSQDRAITVKSTLKCEMQSLPFFFSGRDWKYEKIISVAKNLLQEETLTSKNIPLDSHFLFWLSLSISKAYLKINQKWAVTEAWVPHPGPRPRCLLQWQPHITEVANMS